MATTTRATESHSSGVDKVLLAAPRSFCAGVEMAIKALAWMVRIFEPPVYCYHEIVHNRLVVERFERLGVIFCDSIEEVPEGAPVMLSAHGTAPHVIKAAQAKGRVVVDAACPLVTKVHQGVKVRTKKGYTVVYAGHEGHQEAVGTIAVAPHAVRLVENATDVAALKNVEGPVAFLTQTTLSFGEWQEVLDATQARFPDVWVPEGRDLCFATTNRQSAVRKVALHCDTMVVIGSANSSNALALVKTARAAGCAQVVRIDGPAELPAGLTGTIGVTAGASTPEDVVRDVLERLAPAEGVEEVTASEEDEYFPPPRELRDLLRNIDLDPEAEAMAAKDRTMSAMDVLDSLTPRRSRSCPEAREFAADGPVGRADPAVESLLRRYVAQVEAEMAAAVHETVDDAWMRGAIGYHLGWADTEFRPLPDGAIRAGGKKLRPTLAILAYQGAMTSRQSGNMRGHSVGPEGVISFAAALELLHQYSLVHDDIQDGDRFRRGRPTLWTLCGAAQAINVGNCLHALALRCLDRSRTRGIDDATVGELIVTLATTSIELTTGQKDDLAFETEPGVDPDRYLDMIAGKTAALIRCATYGGARLAVSDSGSAADMLEAYANFGTHLGLAFQIRDDVLGIWGSEAETGKPMGRDIRRKKKTLPVIFTFRQAPLASAVRLRNLYSQADELTAEQEAEVRKVLDGCDALHFSQGIAKFHRDEAVGALTSAAGGSREENPYLTELEALAEFATYRKY